MKHITPIAFAAGSLATAGIAVLIAAGPEHNHGQQLKEKRSTHSMNPMDDMDNTDDMGNPDEAKMMAEMMRLATPNEHHADLAKSIGTWSAQTSFITDPSQPAVEGQGTMTITSVLGGRYIMSEFKMDFMGQPFEGLGFNGYDIAHEQYIATWADTMSTKITYLTGNKDENGDLVMTGTATTPKGDSPMKIVTSFDGDDRMTDKFYDQKPDGTWIQSGTITYTRD